MIHSMAAPSRPARWCPRCQTSHPGACPVAAASFRKQADERRGTAAQRGYGARWQKASKAFLAAHRICVEDERDGQLVASQVVDHIVPHKGDMKLFWDSRNWQALCKSCHDRKTAREDGGFGHARR